MPSGGCFCDAVKIELSEKPAAQVLCHCRDCQKISGSIFSTNIIVPESGFKVTKGKPKSIVKTADSGGKITSYFCADCGTTIYRLGEKSPGMVIIKAGVLDDLSELEAAAPSMEIFTATRVNWQPKITEKEIEKGMP